eukprot:CAMPEP_0114243508 /NCGR_PEP_ID=MMETSP0058-20121206/10828_1 /TAXON_ID=36894 /ORGANISM="Pyramimonas parkeae, CCMP726" /LENGTH=344 /DNA_ID=CAMNT_0001356355 /DNA_START=18 /DNA_END=1052 /DNA_ORIENTATION=+
MASTSDRVKVLENFGLPSGMAEVLEKEDRKVGMRIFILDNSGSTSSSDGLHVPKLKPGDVSVQAQSCSRWEEIKRMAIDQAELNAQTQTPCKFFLLNPKQGSNWNNLTAGQDFCEINPHRGNLQDQVQAVRQMVDNSGPDGGTPLAKCIEAVGKLIKDDMESILEKDKRGYLVLVTDGLPDTGKDQMVTEIRKLCVAYELFVVVRLCTAEQNVVDYYNKVDEEVEFSLDVLCNLEAEAREIKAVNPWLSYFPELHAIREGGTNLRLLDLLDERPFTGDETAKFIQMIMHCKGDNPMPGWREVDKYMQALNELDRRRPKVYNPCDRTMKSMVDMEEVRKALTASL